jgi:tetratricopeptide (TPR) repeat protein
MINRVTGINTPSNQRPRNAEEFFSSAALHFNRGRYEEAILDYNEAIRINPQYANAFVHRGAL